MVHKSKKGIETSNSHRDDFVDRDLGGCDLARDLGVCDFDRDLCRDPLSNKHNTINNLTAFLRVVHVAESFRSPSMKRENLSLQASGDF